MPVWVLKCRFCPLKCRFWGLKCRFCRKKIYNKKSRKGSPSYVSNNPNVRWVFVCSEGTWSKGHNPPRGSQRKSLRRFSAGALVGFALGQLGSWRVFHVATQCLTMWSWGTVGESFGNRFLSSAGTGKHCAFSMRLPSPSPVLDKNRAPMGPEIFYPVAGGRLLRHFQTPVLYWIYFSLRDHSVINPISDHALEVQRCWEARV